MTFEMKMPDLATTGGEITVLQWLVEVGAVVRRGVPLLEVETDKAVMEVEATQNGELERVLVQPGDAVTAGQPIALIANGQAATSSPTEELPQIPIAPPSIDAELAAPPTRSGGMFARNRQAAQKTARAPRPLALNVAHRTLARRMSQSKANIPHFYLQTSLNAGPMIQRRNAGDPKPAWDAFFAWAVARSLRRYPRLLYRFEDDQLLPQAGDAIGVAVDLDGDLYVAPVKGVGDRSPEEISVELRNFVDRLRANDRDARALQPTAFTITNLGASNVTSFIPIINPPEAAILAIGTIAPVPAVIDDRIVIQTRANLTLAVDHRVTNGKYAAAFLNAVVQELETL